MAYAIKLDSHGPAESLKYVEIPDIAPAAGEVRLRHTAIGVNYIDVYYREGSYKANFPLIPGIEGAGVIEAVGPDVTGFKAGDRVAYGTALTLNGGYSTHRNIPARLLVKIPYDISDEVAATIMVKGMTAHFLLKRTFAAQPGMTILVHAAAGGVGTYLCQWASAMGITVIGTVGSTEKLLYASENGCHFPINYKIEDFAAQVKELTAGIGVPVVYDSVGKDTFVKSLECLTPLGLLVSFGQSSGKIPPFDISMLAAKSNFITRPSLGFYKSDRNELVLSAADIFDALKGGALKPRINHRIALKDAAQAHRLLEDRKTMGSIVLIP